MLLGFEKPNQIKIPELIQKGEETLSYKCYSHRD